MYIGVYTWVVDGCPEEFGTSICSDNDLRNVVKNSLEILKEDLDYKHYKQYYKEGRHESCFMNTLLEIIEKFGDGTWKLTYSKFEIKNLNNTTEKVDTTSIAEELIKAIKEELEECIKKENSTKKSKELVIADLLEGLELDLPPLEPIEEVDSVIKACEYAGKNVKRVDRNFLVEELEKELNAEEFADYMFSHCFKEEELKVLLEIEYKIDRFLAVEEWFEHRRGIERLLGYYRSHYCLLTDFDLIEEIKKWLDLESREAYIRRDENSNLYFYWDSAVNRTIVGDKKVIAKALLDYEFDSNFFDETVSNNYSFVEIHQFFLYRYLLSGIINRWTNRLP